MNAVTITKGNMKQMCDKLIDELAKGRPMDRILRKKEAE